MSVQVQLRRDTLANVLANHGALGEVFISTDTKELFIQDGATNGGFGAGGTYGAFGSFARKPALIESAGAGGETLTTGVTTYTSTVQLPAGYKFIMGAGWRINTTITGITTIDFGVTGSATLFAAIQSPSLTAGSTVIYGQNQVRFDAAPVSLLLTSHAGTNFTAGAIRFVVQYILLSPPTS
jgi:Major tropism determinant N-terminal domain